MSKIGFLIFLCFFTIEIVVAQNYNDKIIGTWVGERKLDTLVEPVEWTFLAAGKGMHIRVLSSAKSNGIVCEVRQSLTWFMKPEDQIVINTGKATCVCVSNGGQSLEEIDDFLYKCEVEMTNEELVFDIEFKNRHVLRMDNTKLKRK